MRIGVNRARIGKVLLRHSPSTIAGELLNPGRGLPKRPDGSVGRNPLRGKPGNDRVFRILQSGRHDTVIGAAECRRWHREPRRFLGRDEQDANE